jgi:hypothetical protein
VLQKAKERANANNAEFDLTEDWIWSRFETGKCEATGISFSFDQTDDERRNPFAPSVDRIDNNNKNYTMDNCRLVVSAFNIMRADWSDETLKILNKGFSNYLKSLDA